MIGYDISVIIIINDIFMDHFELDKEFQLSNNQDGYYYHEYCRFYLANVALTSQVKQLIQEKNQLLERLSKYEDDQFISSGERGNEKNKRMRRNADQIERYYKCTVKVCGKSYGSEGSLNQHYKLKHPQIYVSLPNVQSNSSQPPIQIENRAHQQNKDPRGKKGTKSK